MLLNHGQKEQYKHRCIGINGRLDAVQAAVLNVKLKHFNDEVEARKRIGARYSEKLKNTDIITPVVEKDRTSVYAQYSIRVKKRKDLIKTLNDCGVPTAIHYPMPLHLQEAFTALGHKTGDFEVAEQVSHEIMSLPMSGFLSTEQQDYIIEIING